MQLPMSCIWPCQATAGPNTSLGLHTSALDVGPAHPGSRPILSLEAGPARPVPGIMIFLPPVSLALGAPADCSLSVLDGHPQTRGTLWAAAPLHSQVCRVELGAWLNLWQPQDAQGAPEATSSMATQRGECGARLVMHAATYWPSVECRFVPSHRQAQTWDRLARQQIEGGTEQPWTAYLAVVAQHLAGAGVPTAASDTSSSATRTSPANPVGAWGVQPLSECMATPGWLLAYLLQWSPKRIRAKPRQLAARALSALARSSTSGRLEWSSVGGVVQVQDGHFIDWANFARVAELLPGLAKRDAAWLDCRPPWSLSSALWVVAGSLLPVPPRPMPSSDRHILRDFLDWAVCQLSRRLDCWARSPRGPARDLDQLVRVRRLGERTRLPTDLLHRLASRKHPRATLEEWQASGLVGGCNTGNLTRRWNSMYLVKGRSVLSEALTLNLTLDATQAGGNSVEICVVWGVEVQTCAYAPPQASWGNWWETGRLKTGSCRNLLSHDRRVRVHENAAD